MCTLSVSNVIYHKFSHGAAFYTLNGRNVNVMLEFLLIMANPTKACRRKKFGYAQHLDIFFHSNIALTSSIATSCTPRGQLKYTIMV